MLRLAGRPGPGSLAAQRALPAAAVLLVAAVTVVAELRVLRTRAATSRVVAGLSAPDSALVTRRSGVTDVLFAVPGTSRWVTAAGTDVIPRDAPHLVVSDAGVPAVRLQLSDAADEAAVVAALTPANRMALRNAQLTAAVRARLAEVRASRRRIVATSDAERRRIERDLHDGAQQRLVGVALHLQVALARVQPPGAEVLREAEGQVRQALVRLRRLAHGVQPDLAEDGLPTALDELAAGSPAPLTVDVQVGRDLDAETATAVYVAIADAVRGVPADVLPAGSSMSARVRDKDGDVTMALSIPTGSSASGEDTAAGLRTALSEAPDRLAAGWHAVDHRRRERRGRDGSDPVRVVVADDVMLVRSGLARLLGDAGVDVVAEAADAEALLRAVAMDAPDVAIVDIRMPPTHTDEGLVAARQIRELHPGTAGVLLSQYLQIRYAERLLADQPGGVGYLLKKRVSDIAVLVDALRRVTEGECVIDPTIVARLMRRRRADSPLTRLTSREDEILALMAQGRSNAGIAGELGISERTVEAACAQVFRKLDLEPSPDLNRRVLAVLELLRS